MLIETLKPIIAEYFENAPVNSIKLLKEKDYISTLEKEN